MNKLNVLLAAKEVSEEMIHWRRDLHQIPELGLVLPKTVAYVKKY
jgi:Metal-dependent amidase/aminoacylase/carboxypeptidase